MTDYIFFSWIDSLLVGGCICTLLLYLFPEGKTKAIAEIACSCIMLLIFVSPVRQINYERFSSEIEKLYFDIQLQEESMILSSENMLRNIIEQQFEEYILSEATMVGVYIKSVDVTTIQNEAGEWIPYEVTYTAEDEVSTEFKEHILNQLGIAKERQNTYEITDQLE